MKIIQLVIISIFLSCLQAIAQDTSSAGYVLLKPDRVFDGQQTHTNCCACFARQKHGRVLKAYKLYPVR